ncbi:hypothetical protein [Mycolicibacterium brumae]|uniref:hypothetical protein n=1 Tax=Mycolicibacterium brumae TaxID=85968 RepID=UPI0021F28B0D|nr:hypothetical protein [Mycolicibacterium brumae]MCV7193763.1 hypothetical protein [Mycolicibacterium brumae]
MAVFAEEHLPAAVVNHRVVMPALCRVGGYADFEGVCAGQWVFGGVVVGIILAGDAWFFIGIMPSRRLCRF